MLSKTILILSINFIFLPRLSRMLFYNETLQAFKTFVKVCHNFFQTFLNLFSFLYFTDHSRSVNQRRVLLNIDLLYVLSIHFFLSIFYVLSIHFFLSILVSSYRVCEHIFVVQEVETIGLLTRNTFINRYFSVSVSPSLMEISASFFSFISSHL